MKNAFLALCGMAFLFGACQDIEKREVRKETIERDDAGEETRTETRQVEQR